MRARHLCWQGEYPEQWEKAGGEVEDEGLLFCFLYTCSVVLTLFHAYPFGLHPLPYFKLRLCRTCHEVPWQLGFEAAFICSAERIWRGRVGDLGVEGRPVRQEWVPRGTGGRARVSRVKGKSEVVLTDGLTWETSWGPGAQFWSRESSHKGYRGVARVTPGHL